MDIFLIGHGTQAAFECKKGFTTHWSGLDLPCRIHNTGNQQHRMLRAFIADAPEQPFIMAGMVPDALIDTVRALRAHVTVVSGVAHCTDPLAWVVHIDDTSVGQQAVNHLHAAGYQHLACWGSWAAGLRQPRFSAAEERCRQLGIQLHRLIPPADRNQQSLDAWFTETLKQLPQPLGIFVAQDQDSAFLRHLCLRCDVAIPHQVGLLGVDDDVRVCTDMPPELSSVRAPWREVGVQLALTCQQLVHGEGPTQRRRSVAAYGVHRRQSTDHTHQHANNALVNRFMKQARTAAIRGKGVGDLLPRLGVSQPTLYRQVTAAVGRTPSKLILDFRIDKACQLLRETDLTLAEVAKQSGFTTVRSLHAAFVARYPVPPGVWRRG